MCDNPFIVHEFFCAQKRGTRRRVKREQTRIIVVAARKSQPITLGDFPEPRDNNTTD
jgi:hypothetical protein